MAAIITETFRRKMRDLLEQDMIANPYYIGIGKSNSWEPNSSGTVESSTTFNVPIPSGTPGDDLETLNNLTSLLKITEENISAAIPNIAWKSGQSYKAYSPHDETCFYSDTNLIYPCYAINTTIPQKPIFLCIQRGAGPSTSPPTLSSYGIQVKPDGYAWVYIQNYINFDDTVNSSSFLQINKQNLVESGAVSSTIASCKNTTGGKIYGFTVVHGGSGYSIADPPICYISIRRTSTAPDSDPTTFESGFELKPVVANVSLPGGVNILGAITGWTFKDDTQNLLTLLNDPANTEIISASVEIRPRAGTAGKDALIVPHISPLNGFGYQPSKDFPGWYMGVYSKLEDDTEDTFFTPYRQISIIRNPSWNPEMGLNAPATLRALRYFTILQSVNIDSSIVGVPIRILYTASGISDPVIGYADLIYNDLDNLDTKRLYFHQSYSSGFGHIPNTGKIYIGNMTTPIDYTAVSSDEYIMNTGEIVFTENRKPISRAPQQAEELKIIIQL
jgi:hypothetical protein